MSINGAIDIGKGTLMVRGGTMAAFVEILYQQPRPPVVDRTGLTGHYDFTLNYDQSSTPSTARPGTDRDAG